MRRRIVPRLHPVRERRIARYRHRSVRSLPQRQHKAAASGTRRDQPGPWSERTRLWPGGRRGTGAAPGTSARPRPRCVPPAGPRGRFTPAKPQNALLQLADTLRRPARKKLRFLAVLDSGAPIGCGCLAAVRQLPLGCSDFRRGAQRSFHGETVPDSVPGFVFRLRPRKPTGIVESTRAWDGPLHAALWAARVVRVLADRRGRHAQREQPG
jgi:hypothetical protein